MIPHQITAKTQLVGLIGWPVSHSVSPAMHNAAFAKLGLNWRYVPLPVPLDPAERIGEAVRGVRALGMKGCNVTVPHKQSVMPHLDALTQAAEAIGAVNTIIVQENGALLGDNTDAPGFVRDVKSHGVALAGKRALVLGAGGSSRAVVYGLAEAGCESIAIVNRTAEKAQELAAAMQPYFPSCTVKNARLTEAAPHADFVVNCTSLGMTPKVDSTPWDEAIPFRKEQIVYDLVYNPRETRLMRKAAVDGATAVGGLGMLVWQGAIALERWTGKSAPVETMADACFAAMEKNSA